MPCHATVEIAICVSSALSYVKFASVGCFVFSLMLPINYKYWLTKLVTTVEVFLLFNTIIRLVCFWHLINHIFFMNIAIAP